MFALRHLSNIIKPNFTKRFISLDVGKIKISEEGLQNPRENPLGFPSSNFNLTLPGGNKNLLEMEEKLGIKVNNPEKTGYWFEFDKYLARKEEDKVLISRFQKIEYIDNISEKESINYGRYGSYKYNNYYNDFGKN